MTDEERQQLLNQLQNSTNPYDSLMNGTFRDTGRVASSPGEYADSVLGAPVRTGVDQAQKGNFNFDGLKAMFNSIGSDPKNAPTGVDLAQNMGIQNPYLGAAVATGLDVGAQLPIGEIASMGKVIPGMIGSIEDISKLKDIDSPLEIINKIDTPEKAAALSGEERQTYMNALDRVYGDKSVRAKNLGFSPETYYHGTPNNEKVFDSFRSDKSKSGQHYGRGNYVTPNPEDANLYASHLDDHNGAPSEDSSGVIYPLKIRSNSPLDTTNYDPQQLAKINDLLGLNPQAHPGAAALRSDPTKFSKALVDSGYDSIKNPNENITNVINSKNLRSVNAAFDPRFKDSNNLLAGNLSPTNINGINSITPFVNPFEKLKSLFNRKSDK